MGHRRWGSREDRSALRSSDRCGDRPHLRRARARGAGGQAAVELALVLPVVVVFLLGLLQVALVARDQLAVELAAREGARAALVSAQPGAAATGAARRATS
ncbi:MAG: TadE/TadG family type IV pilus assembly protein, partial [Ilumatobacteraceae bacterium]